MRLVRPGMGSSGWACSDILILLLVFMRKLLITFSLYSTLFSFPCPLVRTKFPSRVIHTPYSIGCVSFFCTQEGGGRIQEKRPGEKEEHESQEEQTGAESPDATSERRPTRRVGDDPMEARATDQRRGERSKRRGMNGSDSSGGTATR